MLSLHLAYRNLIGAGLRTWLSAIVLSTPYIVIIYMQGLLAGWNHKARHDTIQEEIGGGQYWHEEYDPFDPLTYEDSHGPIPSELARAVSVGDVAPILVTQATIYPQGRMQNIVIKGIAPEQKVVTLPTETLATEDAEIPVMIGKRMAKDAVLGEGDYVILRWRDVNGAFDARDARIVHIMDTDVPALDNGTFWVPLEGLRSMLQLPGEATLLVVAQQFNAPKTNGDWVFRDQEFLMQDLREMMQMENASYVILYAILLALALIAIFDVQVLSIFRRRREIGTLIALGMTRGRVICLFTIEGALHGVLAVMIAAMYGVPLFIWQARAGIPMPKAADEYGITIGDAIYPVYSVRLVVGTILVIMVAVTVVSFLPARRIAQMNPTDALRGRVS